MSREQDRRHRLGLVVLALFLASQPLMAHGYMPTAHGHGKVTRQSRQPTSPSSYVRGMAYGPFREGQSPELGIHPTLPEVQQDMSLLRLVANGIRSYGCQHLETVVTATQEISLPLTLGAWLSGDAEADRAEIECAVGQAQANPHITSLVVGNESVLRGQLTVTEVCSYTQEVRERTGLPVTTAEPWDMWVDHPDLAACADYLMVHIHPYSAGAHAQRGRPPDGAPRPDGCVTFLCDSFSLVHDLDDTRRAQYGEYYTKPWSPPGRAVAR